MNWLNFINKILVPRRAGVILITLGGLFCLFAIFQFDIGPLSGISVQDKHLALGFGIAFVVVGLLCSIAFSWMDKRSALKPLKTRRQIVIYFPMLKRNPFFHELLDQFIELAVKKGMDVITRKATIVDKKVLDDSANVLKEFDGVNQTVIVVIPPNPQCYQHLFELEVDVNLIVLDVELLNYKKLYDNCNYAKAAILLDNDLGTKLSAEEVVRRTMKEPMKHLSVIICEGEFHDRGRSFWNHLRIGCQDAKLPSPILIGGMAPGNFYDPVEAGFRHTERTIREHLDQVRQTRTYVFCSNDPMALGARLALSRFLKSDVSEVRILGFDASDITRDFIEHSDPHLCWSVDQRYDEYALHTIEAANKILSGGTVNKEPVLIAPGLFTG